MDQLHQQGSVAKVGHFLWHLLQMVLAMAVGMAIYVALFRLVPTPESYQAMQIEQPLLWYSEMAVFMTPTGLIALVQLGVTAYLPWLSTRTLPESTHIAMSSMLVSMLYRHAEYSGDRDYHSGA
jgi:hypothetical protein